MRNGQWAALAALLIGTSACMSMSSGGGGPARVVDGAWVGQNGMTLYTFERDGTGAGKSVCNGACATNWPPLTATAGDKSSGDWTVITRDDGSAQWAYKGKPLYFWVKDAKPGDRTGDGVNNVWRLARP